MLPQQEEAARWLAARTHALLALPIGFGKTAVTLHAFAELREYHPEWRALLVTTKNICNLTWGQEIEKWGFGLRYKSVAGRRGVVRTDDWDILAVNFESLEWLLDLVDNRWIDLPEVLIIDESSKMKSHSANRVKRLIGHGVRGVARRSYVPRFQRRWLLSGSPAPEGLEDLWSQSACMDPRRPLGTNISEFREVFCGARWNGFGNVYEVHAMGRQEIERRLRHVMYVPKEHDDLGLVPPTHSKVVVPWSAEGRAQYDELEDTLATMVGENEDVEIEASNRAVVINKMRQLCSGFIYGDYGEAHPSKDPEAKLDALERIVEQADGRPILVFNQYIEEVEMIQRRFPGAIDGAPTDLTEWNKHRIPMMILHPRSASHGLNLQYGSSICVFFSLPYSYEEWFQAWGRLHRRGQTEPVSVIRLERENSIEADVWKVVQGKDRRLSALLNNMRQRRR